MVRLLSFLFAAFAVSVVSAGPAKWKGDDLACRAGSTSKLAKEFIIKVNDGGLTQSMIKALHSISDSQDGSQTGEDRRSEVLEKYKSEIKAVKDPFLADRRFSALHVLLRTDFGPELIVAVDDCGTFTTLLDAKEVETIEEVSPLRY